MSLTDKQEAFAQEYLVDLNATQAAIRAGYSESTAGSIGFENLKKPKIQQRIQELMDQRSKRTEITADRVLQEIARLAFSDITNYLTIDGNSIRLKDFTELTEDQTRAIEQVYETKHGLRIKLADKRSSLELLGKHLQLFKEYIDVTTNGEQLNTFDFSKLTSEQKIEFARLIRELRASNA